jgi:hypothetical protein
MLTFRLQPKQSSAFHSKATEILFGGAAGGGKSHFLRVAAIVFCMLIPGLQVYFFRRTFPDLWRNHMLGPSSFPALLAPMVAAGKCRIIEGHHQIVFPNDAGHSRIQLCHCQREQDVLRYQGAEMHMLCGDEFGHFTESMYRYLRGRVRMGGLMVAPEWRGRFPRIYLSANPGGVGHAWLKRGWIDDAKAMQLRPMPRKEGGMIRQYIPSRLEDNAAMLAADPNYEQRLEGLGSATLVDSLRYGVWDVFAGQAFTFTPEHICDPLPIPRDAELLMTHDWGFGKPFSIGWWWIDSDGRLYRFAEWYGASDGAGDMGLRMTDADVAAGIISREKDLGIWGMTVTRLAGHDCFAPKPRYEGGGQGPSTALTFAAHGLLLRKANVRRPVKWREFHSRLRIPRDPVTRMPTGERPMLLVYPSCVDFIRIIPTLPVDPKTSEDVDTESEDHIYDEAAQACTYKPLGVAGEDVSGVDGAAAVASKEVGR